MDNNNSGGGFHFHVHSGGNQIGQNITNTIYGNVIFGQKHFQETIVFTDEQIDKAITAINGQGKALNSKQRWAGVYWYLRWACNYPKNSNDFCDKANRLPSSGLWEIECNNNNIRSITTLSFMDQDPRQMDKVKPSKNDEGFFYQCKEVALALAQELANQPPKARGF